MSEISDQDRKKIQRELREIGHQLKMLMSEKIELCIMTCDIEGLERLVMIYEIYLSHEVLNSLKKKGLRAQIRELCNLAGRMKP